jgi:hypothetical protein
MEREDTLAKTINRCKKEPALLEMGEVSVVFLLCRVGDSPTAEAFLQKIVDDEDLKNMVYCAPESIDTQLAVFQKVRDHSQYFGWVCFSNTLSSSTYLSCCLY